jgi:hypothetical protein
LHGGLLSIDVETAVVVISYLGQAHSLFRELLKYLQVVLLQTYVTTKSYFVENLLQFCIMSFQLEEVTIGISVNLGQSPQVISWSAFEVVKQDVELLFLENNGETGKVF